MANLKVELCNGACKKYCWASSTAEAFSLGEEWAKQHSIPITVHVYFTDEKGNNRVGSFSHG